MPPHLSFELNVCSRCLATGSARLLSSSSAPVLCRSLHHTTPGLQSSTSGSGNDGRDGPSPGLANEHGQRGAMSRRLEEMTDNSLELNPKAARRVIQDAGFSEDLKKHLEDRIKSSTAPELTSRASAALSLPSSAGAGTRDVATAKPWTGNETFEDASLRMLTDAHKPLRTGRPSRLARPRSPPIGVDARMRQATKVASGERLANARDKTSIYAISQDPGLSEKEREEMRKILKERFQPGARPMPTSVQGLASLANERIEDAIARGQFKNIPRGKGVNKEIDYNANSPFLNTTEYFMNKMIQRQDIVPPWIEKQQEVTKTARAFRARLRSDWKRHAARMIASKGGSLRDQIRRAEAHALAEAELHPKPEKVESGSASQIDSAGQLALKTSTEVRGSKDATIDMLVVQETVKRPHGYLETAAPADRADSTRAAAASTVFNEDGAKHHAVPHGVTGETPPSSTTRQEQNSIAFDEAQMSSQPRAASPIEDSLPRLQPFRDPAWESIELAYHRAALQELNTLTRSYNLMAPEIAKKPYYSLDRELKSCFADVAPLLAAEIRDRARRPPPKVSAVDLIGHRPGSVLERFGGQTAPVYDSKKPNYGFKEFWQELWSSGGDSSR